MTIFYHCVRLVVLKQLEAGVATLEGLWETRRLKLDLCLQLRLFEREALEVQNLATITNTCYVLALFL